MFPNIFGLYHLLFKYFLNIKSAEVNDLLYFGHIILIGAKLYIIFKIILCDNISSNLTGAAHDVACFWAANKKICISLMETHKLKSNLVFL